MNELWDLWFPNAGATGLSFARCRVGADAATGRVLVHAAPRHLEVVVRNDQGGIVAEGPDLSEWRWQLELSNRQAAPAARVASAAVGR
jgi:hypothetical protein